uniref:Polyadenylate-binding protein-interacting protein 1 n=1 Tax=Amphiprion ocellaris TaxID=80972 RepID=A0AAQ5ZCJ1_AMPOC
MNDNFDRAPGAGRTRNLPADPGFVGGTGDADSKTTLFNQREPLRQPRTSPPFAENNVSSTTDMVAGGRRFAGFFLFFLFVCFHISTVIFVQDPTCYDDGERYYGEATLADMVTDFLGHLSSSPGSFESDVDYITAVLNDWVTTEELLKELVELIYTQSTAIPNFSYTGARLCNYLSHHLTISPPNGNFRQLLLQRCRKEYEQRDVAVGGDTDTQKKFHSFVLFLGELYLHLEIKSGKGPPKRADILLTGLKDLMNSLFSNPVDANLICAVKLLKLTGSVLDDAWKESGKPHMEELIQRIETILLDATCSRDVRQMLLKLVELRSSDWGRVRAAAAASNATPENDPNYFMNEPTFYTEDGTPFTAADPEYAEKYQEILDRQDYFHDIYGENGNEV